MFKKKMLILYKVYKQVWVYSEKYIRYMTHYKTKRSKLVIKHDFKANRIWLASI